MKKIIACILLVVLLAQFSIAYADSCPLPKKNTDKEILFSGFEWYTDYKNTLAAASKKGFVNNYDWSRDNFDADKCVTPHWHTVYNSINSFAGSEAGCGGYLAYYSDVPNVAGYKIDEVKLYFMWNPEGTQFSDYKASEAVRFYMAKYEFDVTDKRACYDDLLKKLKGLYGENPETSTYGWVDPTTYTVWVNGDNALMALSVNEYVVTLVYLAPGAEEMLCQTESVVRKNEIAQVKDDTSGL